MAMMGGMGGDNNYINDFTNIEDSVHNYKRHIKSNVRQDIKFKIKLFYDCCKIFYQGITIYLQRMIASPMGESKVCPSFGGPAYA